MKALSLHEIQIDCPFAIQKLLQLHIKVKVNTHGTCEIRAIASEKNFDQLETALRDKSIIVHGRGEVLFAGFMLSVKQLVKHEYVVLDMLCISSSYQMDIKKFSRSYQDVKQTYGSIAQKSADSGNTGSVHVFSEDHTIDLPVFQYLETDWAFAKRMAGNLSTVLLPNLQSFDTEVGIGFPRRSQYDLADNEFESYSKSHETIQYEGMFSKQFQKTYMVRSNDIYQLGDQICFKDETFIIGGMEIGFEQALSSGVYTIGRIDEFMVPKHINENLNGASFLGKVIDVQETKLKLHLEIDMSQDVDTAYWYEYMPCTCKQ